MSFTLTLIFLENTVISSLGKRSSPFKKRKREGLTESNSKSATIIMANCKYAVADLHLDCGFDAAFVPVLHNTPVNLDQINES